MSNWTARAACVGLDPELFFPHPSDTERIADAQSVCARCPVTAECAELSKRPLVTNGVEHSITDGVWAGVFINRDAGIGRPKKPCGTEAAYYRHRRNGEPPCRRCRDEMNRMRNDRRYRDGTRKGA